MSAAPFQAKQLFRRWYTRAKYNLFSGMNRSSMYGKDWGFLENFDDLGDLARFDHQIEALYRSRLRNLRLIKSGHYERNTFASMNKLNALFERPYRVIICIPWLNTGGAERVAANLAAAFRNLYGEGSVAVLVMDFSPTEVRKLFSNQPAVASWFASDVPLVDVSGTKSLDPARRLAAFAKLILSIAPEFVVCVNSQTMWDCFQAHGHQMSRYLRLIGCLFCNDYDLRGAPCGHAVSHFRETVANVEAVITDQVAFATELSERYMLLDAERAKLHCIYQPVSIAIRVADDERLARLRRSPSYRRQILWAGRLTRQKDPQLLAQIADRAPYCDIHVYGSGKRSELGKSLNVFYHGPFDNFETIPTGAFDAFLYTSRWDGLPNVLLEAAACRLPIIAQLTGGIGELVTESTGWPVEGASDLDRFLARIHEVCFEFDAHQGLARLDAMSQLIQRRHTFETFCQSVKSVFGPETNVNADHHQHY
jgi:glycosyltransferase involved in cell wall biosynthesis